MKWAMAHQSREPRDFSRGRFSERLKKGKALVEGYLKMQGGKPSEFYSPNFTFNDKYDVLRAGYFESGEEFLKFQKAYDYEIANK